MLTDWPATAEVKAWWGGSDQLQLSTYTVVHFQQQVLLETSVSGCLFQRWHLLPAVLTSPIAHTFTGSLSYLSCLHATPSPSPVAPPSWRFLACIGRQDPGTEGGCLEMKQQHIDFQMRGKGEASQCPLWDAGSWQKES